MRVTRLAVANLRAVQTAEFAFERGFNLIVGVNGAGKTSIIDALRVTISSVVGHTNTLRRVSEDFTSDDIRVGATALTVECSVEIENKTHKYLIHRPRFTAEARATEAGEPRTQHLETPPRSEFVGSAPEVGVGAGTEGRPLGVLFSTKRSIASRRTGRVTRAAKDPVARAYAEAFDNRELLLAEFADWMKVLVTTAHERRNAGSVLDAFEQTVSRFLPGYRNLRLAEDQTSTLVIDRGTLQTMAVDDLPDLEAAQVKAALESVGEQLALNPPQVPESATQDTAALERAYLEAKAKLTQQAVEQFAPRCRNLRANDRGEENSVVDVLPVTLNLARLSDGERGALALVLDLTRRLAMANPEMDRPTEQAEAVVLIDELDLHLHPSWQRRIIRDLTAAFPRCQFIATTHSPQIIGEVEPEQIHIIADGEVYSPQRSFGVDSSRVLEEVMDTTPRSASIHELITNLSRALSDEDLESARTLLKALTEEVGEEDSEVVRARTFLDFLEDGNASDS
jgi:predicted ATP-binding protein involved in virulence